jgi:hypothetical protein
LNGTLFVKVDVVLTGMDLAEEFDVETSDSIEAGDVMTLDDSGALRACSAAQDKKVVGIVSGAGEYKPGLILGRIESLQKRHPIALAGRVLCKVDAQYGAIEIGDLLTTSPTIGHAMRVSDPVKAFGCVIGKAMQRQQSGKGLIPVLISLQ